jgi:hypothetical protein
MAAVVVSTGAAAAIEALRALVRAGPADPETRCAGSEARSAGGAVGWNGHAAGRYRSQ